LRFTTTTSRMKSLSSPSRWKRRKQRSQCPRGPMLGSRGASLPRFRYFMDHAHDGQDRRGNREAVVTDLKTQVFQNHIGGTWQVSATGQTYPNHNPADSDDIAGNFQDSDQT